MALAIETSGLRKVFPGRRGLARFLPGPAGGGAVPAVDGVDLAVAAGEVFALVGPNGAGKTTLIKLLCTLVLPTAGRARVAGFDLSRLREIKARIGLVTPDERSFYWRLTCLENLRFFAGVRGLTGERARARIARLAEQLELGDILNRRFDGCSSGAKQRLSLARGLLHEPEVLFLDEPTGSLDPLAAAAFRMQLQALAREEGRTIFLVTHDLQEAAELADRAALMLGGRLRILEDPNLLREAIVSGGGREGAASRGGDSWKALAARLSAGRPDLGSPPASGGPGPGKAAEADPQERRVAVAVARSANCVVDSGGRSAAAAGAAPAGNVSSAVEEARGGDRHAAGGRLRLALLFLRRDLLVQLSYRFNFILDISGVALVVTAFFFLSQLIGPQGGGQLGRYAGDYFSFVLVGIAFLGYQNVALGSFSEAVRQGQVSGTLEHLLATPLRLSDVLFLSGLWPLLFATARMLSYLVLGGLFFGATLGSANLLAAFVLLLLSVLALSGFGILSACFIMIFKRGDPVNFLLGGLSMLLGGVYFPVSILPGWLETAARFFPLRYTLDAMRRALILGDPLPALAGDALILLAFALVMIPLGLVAFSGAVRSARRSGSLSHF